MDNGRIVIDRAANVPARQHGLEICLSHAAALICALGRLTMLSETQLSLEIQREFAYGAEIFRQLTTLPGSWPRLVLSMPKTRTSNLADHPDLKVERPTKPQLTSLP